MARIDDIIQAEQKRIESVLRAAFAAGEESARANILAILSGPHTTPIGPASETHDTEGRKRAPKGLPRKLVKRVLRENANFGSTPQDIVDAAITEDERMIAVSTIRGELRKGLESGLYIDRDGRWYLDKDAVGEADQDEDNE